MALEELLYNGLHYIWKIDNNMLIFVECNPGI